MVWEPSKIGVRCLREEFGIDVFNDIRMREYLSYEAYKRLTNMLKRGDHQIIDLSIATEIANAMKNWAVSRGATHFCHWFQPLSGTTAEKHDSFIGHYDPLGRPLLEFDGSALVRGEGDASSFPHGGLRSTDKARGYTVWDPISPAFLRHYKIGSVLYIPTAFASWSGEALDMKVPLLKSDAVLSRETIRCLRLIGDNEATRATTTLGCEQEFFIIDKAMYEKRVDLVHCGRTLIGAFPPKGQELEDHYFNTIPRKVNDMMQDVEANLWKLGIPMKTRHNEVAPAQHEFAPVFEFSTLAVDHQMMTMTVLTEVSREHGFECLLHEKPFSGVNGSGKHNNWSVCTDSGVNLLDPGYEVLRNPSAAFDCLSNLRFSLFLAAVTKAVDDYAGPIRCSIASVSNDLRLGANEAPPAIISVYLGSAIQDLVDTIIKINELPTDIITSPSVIKNRTNKVFKPDINFPLLPTLNRDLTDRNRTSPFAFTGNKFEFRAVGSNQNSAQPLTAINCAVALALRYMADKTEAYMASANVDSITAMKKVIIDTYKTHYRIYFDGNGYADDWVKEAAKRGLPNYKSTPEALSAVNNIEMYQRAGVLSEAEAECRVNIALENYIKMKRIEGRSMVYMANRNVIPSAEKTIHRLTTTLREFGESKLFKARLQLVKDNAENILSLLDKISPVLAYDIDNLSDEALYLEKHLIPIMTLLRKSCDAVEDVCAGEDWSIPTYEQMLWHQC